MSGIEIETGTGTSIGTGDDQRELPPMGDEFCHIDSGDGRVAYCGYPTMGEITCPLYQGESICPRCGLATCLRCATQSSLHERLVDGIEGES